MVLASRAETYGMVVTEALARGLPVVAADVGGVTEALGHGADGIRPGLLVPPDDPAALAAALRALARRRRAESAVAPGRPRAARVAPRVVDHRVRRRRCPGRGVAMTAEVIRVSSEWLALREPADAAARARDLVERLGRRLPATGRWVIHDLGCGTGAMGRWLAPLLPGPQHWVLHDRDADLLEVAAADPPGPAADGAAVTVETRHSDITRLHPGDLAGASLITASALLDMLTEDELAALVTVCAGAGCPVLLTLSVVGRVELTPADPLDRRVAAAFDAHQRRATERGRLLGPDAVARRRRASSADWAPRCSSGPAPGDSAPRRPTWRRSGSPGGWVPRASSRPSWPPRLDVYTRRRLAQAAAGQLAVTVDHADLLVLP